MNKKDKITELLNKARECHKKNNLDEAKQIYILVLNLDTTNFEAHNNLCVIYSHFGETQKAIECYKNSILHNPNFLKGHSNLALNYYNLGDLENSYKHHKKFLKL